MKKRNRIIALAAGSCVAPLMMFSGSAAAVFPDFAGCQRSVPDVAGCLNVQSRTGSLTIKGFAVPIGTSFQLRGTLAYDSSTSTGYRFYPPTGTTGVFAKPVQVPGGLLGIDFPIPGNAVTATAKLAGPVSGITVDPGTLQVRIPTKLALTNPIIGPGCQIGSDGNPIRLNLITGTTSPPAPNRPITGRIGTYEFTSPAYIVIRGNTNVDNSFAVPGASGCGIGLGLINALVNAKLRLPSAAGNNTIIIDNDVAIGGL